MMQAPQNTVPGAGTLWPNVNGSPSKLQPNLNDDPWSNSMKNYYLYVIIRLTITHVNPNSTVIV